MSPSTPIIMSGRVTLSAAAQANAPVRIQNTSRNDGVTDTFTGSDGYYNVILQEVSSNVAVGDVIIASSDDGVNFGAVKYTVASDGSDSENIALTADASPSRGV